MEISEFILRVTTMECMEQLDKIFIGYDPFALNSSDMEGGAPKAFIIITSRGLIEAYADMAYMASGAPLCWEICYDLPTGNRALALIEARRIAARLFGLERLTMPMLHPFVTDDVTVICDKTQIMSARERN